ncbi:uncharacterized protein B0I36DRAFT_247691 [Microdochium trichocladiopsis]|uniref:WW domain-containing protein n=1 Tax=Microdochium trichocladiopsis TaxID=1682393 RepID=A0A9P9BNN7_9PEZI|nr:uncharacterized protein B0I36DRAFT_247691 [Microdochium trichocladiopsis]KAH7027938.1 hypothetical protein B0I36DRAFT_247691 [Microdochium trichocladiopsis]
MLKSTYKPSANLPPPLPPGWTEHKAPTGHTYYYNSETKESTYKRPAAAAAAAPVPPPPPRAAPASDPHQQFFQYSSVPNLADPATANAFLAAYDPARQRQAQNQQGGGGGRGGHHGGPDGRENRPRPQPTDKPRSRVAIPGCEPWVLVYTKYGRRFAYNPVKNASYWRIPEKVMKGVLELDINGVKEKAAGKEVPEGPGQPAKAAQPQEQEQEQEEEEREELGSDYEEVEVTDDEDEGAGDNDHENEDDDPARQHPNKRQRTEEPTEDDLPAEFNEDDIAFQLQAMGEDYGLDPGEYDDGNPEDWPEGAEGEQLSDEDARELFKDMLNDFGINPFSPWEKLIEEGKVFDDPRYTVMPTTKARREVWDEWSREKIQILKEQREREAQSDPKIPYLAFLQEKATPKLYWPEFKRKYKREEPMRSSSMTDKDREKLYRDHIARLKLPQDTLRKDLTALLRAVPLKDLNNQTPVENLPGQVLTDVRYISLPPQTRDPLIAAFLQTLAGPPDAAEAEEDEVSRKKREERRKREKALEERERVVAEEKRRAAKKVERGRAMLREEERELEQAMKVGKDGLLSHLLAAREKPQQPTAAAPAHEKDAA